MVIAGNSIVGYFRGHPGRIRIEEYQKQFGIFLNLRTGPTGHATLFNQ